MERRRAWLVGVILSSLILSDEICGQQASRRSTARPPPDECALFKADDAYALTEGRSTYIEIGERDVSDTFSLSMEVFPTLLNHNGILFSLGTRPNFEYYEWKTAAVHTQFIVVEFIFSALALTVKSLGTQHLHQIEIYKTYPQPYAIDDADWHTVKVTREANDWVLKLDQNLEKREPISNKTDVQLFGKPAFIGGRPNYTDHQFSGVIRKLRINNRAVPLSGLRKEGLVEIWHCSAEEVSRFTTFLKQQRRSGYIRN